MAKQGYKRKKLGGGAKQRMKQRQSGNAVDEEGRIVRSELAHYLLSRFAWGEMSPQELQRLSMYAETLLLPALLPLVAPVVVAA